MNIKEHVRNYRFNIMWNRSHPQTRITEQQQLLHFAERQTRTLEHNTEQMQQAVLVLEQVAVGLLTLLQELKQ